MAGPRRVISVGLLTLGFALVVAGGLFAFYVVPAFEPGLRAPGGVLAIAAVFAGLLLIVSSCRRLEATAGILEEPHIPGLDAEIEEPRAQRKAA